MAFIAGGTFRTGSDKHNPEGAPSHRVTVDGFWVDRTPVTNREGELPQQNLAGEGYARTSPVPAHPPNRYGVYDMRFRSGISGCGSDPSTVRFLLLAVISYLILRWFFERDAGCWKSPAGTM